MKSLSQYITEARIGALSISKLNSILINNINEINPDILGNKKELDLHLYLKDG